MQILFFFGSVQFDLWKESGIWVVDIFLGANFEESILACLDGAE
jgi:hypothetical protein